MSLYAGICIYIYIYTHRERERDKDRFVGLKVRADLGAANIVAMIVSTTINLSLVSLLLLLLLLSMY